MDRRAFDPFAPHELEPDPEPAAKPKTPAKRKPAAKPKETTDAASE